MKNAPCRSRLSKLIVVAATVAALGAGQVQAEEPSAKMMAVGDPLPTLGLKDQHGAEAPVDPATTLVLFTRDMDGGGFVKETLAEDGAAKLAAARALYISDVSGMPSIVRSMFALPSIRKRPYRVVLDETGSATVSMPYREGAVTMLTLDAGKITAIDFATTIDALKSKLAAAGTPAGTRLP